MPKIKNRDWSPDYIDWAFTYWYNHGRPPPSRFLSVIPRMQSPEYPNEFLQYHFAVPNLLVLQDWIKNIFEPRASKLDMEARQTVDQALVAEKVEMLKRHAAVGQQMQDIALDFLIEHKDELGSNSAVRLLVEGLRIERESRGIPATLERIGRMSDEKLLEEIQQLIVDSPIASLEPINDSDSDDELVIDAKD